MTEPATREQLSEFAYLLERTLYYLSLHSEHSEHSGDRSEVDWLRGQVRKLRKDLQTAPQPA